MTNKALLITIFFSIFLLGCTAQNPEESGIQDQSALENVAVQGQDLAPDTDTSTTDTDINNDQPQDQSSDTPGDTSTMTPAPVTELQFQDTQLGSGAEALSGNTVVVHYRGTFEDGSEFDTSYNRGEPFEFSLGAGQVIKGWDEGVVGMKVGGKRKLTIPPDMAYGQRGVPGAIPPNSTLYFEVELLEVK
jgi:FKBP-type peptidyl-prolyl cis-trans isomerase